MSSALARRLAPYIVRLYPRAWRVRYAAEALDLLKLRTPTWGDLGNLAYHVLYTRLHPDLLAGDESVAAAGQPRVLLSDELTLLWAIVAAMIAWLQFSGMIEGGPYRSFIGSAGTWPFLGMSRVNGISVALAAQSAAVVLVLAALLVGGVLLVVAAWRRSSGGRGQYVVPLAALLGAVAPLPLVTLNHGPAATNYQAFATLITDAYCVWFVGLAIASALALSRIVAAIELDDGLVHYTFVLGVVVAAALLLLLGTTVAWGIAAHAEVPRLFDRGNIVFGSAMAIVWMLCVVVMGGAAGMAVQVTIRSARGRAVATHRAV